MNGRLAKLQRKRGLRKTKRVENIRVDDNTNYGFDPKFYKERRSHTQSAKLEMPNVPKRGEVYAPGHEILGYIICKEDAADVHNPTDFVIEKPAKVKKGHEIRAVIKRPLSGVPRPPREYRTVEDRDGELIRIPER